jgi:hypothetical protein
VESGELAAPPRSTEGSVTDAGQSFERGCICGDDGPAGRMVASDIEIKRDDLYPFDRALDELASTFAISVIGELDSDQELGGGDGADGDIGVVGKHIVLFGAPSLS